MDLPAGRGTKGPSPPRKEKALLVLTKERKCGRKLRRTPVNQHKRSSGTYIRTIPVMENSLP